MSDQMGKVCMRQSQVWLIGKLGLLKSGFRVECEENELGRLGVGRTENKIKEFII